jgi:predicted O-methyltransferase YrrM
MKKRDNLNHISFLYKPKLDYIKSFINKTKNINILEFGVMHGRSTKMFLELCKKLNGKLISVDMNDHSNLFNDKKWKFIHSRDDDPDLLKKINNKKFDIIYIDSLHEPNHVKKILYMYFKYLKIGGRVFLDDINWLPYVKNSFKDSEYSEVMNRKIFSKIIEIYYANLENIKLEISFCGTGNANILKLNNKNLDEPKKIKNRIFGFRNFCRIFIKRKPKM